MKTMFPKKNLLPRFSIHRTGRNYIPSGRYIAMGQLYQGIAGVMCTTDLFDLTLWLRHDAEHVIFGRRLGMWFRLLRECENP